MNLIILAAGLGSRFGGLKQFQPIDEHKNFIVDYTIFDAIKCGFNKVVFVIKPNTLETFKNTIGHRVEKFIKTEYAFQENPPFFQNRTKPLGTAHAVLSAKDKIDSPFAVVNADDYYGFDAIFQISQFLKSNIKENQYALIGYSAINTIFDKPVKRGICSVLNNKLLNISESLISKENNQLFATALSDCNKHKISNNQTVSMNLFGFKKSFFDFLDAGFSEFLIKATNKCDGEFFLPDVVSGLIKQNKTTVSVLKTSSVWKGITFKEDAFEVSQYFKKLKQNKIYPEKLW